MLAKALIQESINLKKAENEDKCKAAKFGS